VSDTLLWITGASSGIGSALAATAPFPDVRIIDISRSGGTPGTEHVPADLTDPAAWSAISAHLRAQVADFGGRRIVFVHAAATLEPIGFAGEVDHAAYRAMVLLNAAAPQVLGDAFLHALDAAGFDGPADLVHITSGAASKPYEGWSAYSAGKAAVDMWVRTVGAEQQRRGHARRVVAVSPGVVATDMQATIRATSAEDFPSVERFRQLHADGALLDPADSARRIWRLLDGDVASGAILDVRDAG
jgi:NAD(P)-dependent dehydrogenase (short-subunit alcohol dehydrogenase family)